MWLLQQNRESFASSQEQLFALNASAAAASSSPLGVFLMEVLICYLSFLLRFRLLVLHALLLLLLPTFLLLALLLLLLFHSAECLLVLLHQHCVRLPPGYVLLLLS